MYRLVIYGLFILAGFAVAFGFLDVISYSPWQILLSLVITLSVCLLTHKIFLRLFRAPANIESSIITALILFFIFSPVTNVHNVITLALAGVIAITSKYGFAFRDHHVFNPAAFAAFSLGVAGAATATWWIGSAPFFLLMLILGFTITRKLRRFSMVLTFIGVSVATAIVDGMISGGSIVSNVPQMFTSWPILFFGTVMLTEPLTAPSRRATRVVYASVIGILFSLKFSFGPIFSTPELALLIGNIFSFIISQKHRWQLRLVEKRELAPNILEFVFSKGEGMRFTPGQYIEWTLPHARPDIRGIRRYFTIASSPTENTIRLGVRFSPNGSSFKNALNQLQPGGTMSAIHASGDFLLPNKKDKKLVFIAGGIGVTPFRSMIKYLIDTNQRRDIVLLYACATPEDFAYQDVFRQASESLGLKFIPIVTDPKKAGNTWQGKTGYIDQTMLSSEVPDYKNRAYYLSGPAAMVDAYKRVLRGAGIRRSHVVTDYFPGF